MGFKDLFFVTQQPEPSKVELTVDDKTAHRLSVLGSGDITEWIDRFLYETGKAVSDWRAHPEEIGFLDAAESGAEAVYAAVKELKKRALRSTV